MSHRFESRRAVAAAALLCAACVAGAFTGCRTQDEASDNERDCRLICSKYKQCFDAEYPVEACFTQCDERAGVDLDFEFFVDRCSTCMLDHPCNEASQFCMRGCAEVVGVDAPPPPVET